jgi:hypothetical protein
VLGLLVADTLEIEYRACRKLNELRLAQFATIGASVGANLVV